MKFNDVKVLACLASDIEWLWKSINDGEARTLWTS